MGDVLAFAEQRGGELRGVSNEIVSAAATLAAELGGAAHAVVLGGPGITGAESVGAFGAVRVLVGEHDALDQYVPEVYAEALAAVNRIGAMAEEQGHHPDIHLAWGVVNVEIWTHKIGGLTESDFVFAAKTDGVVASTGG